MSGVELHGLRVELGGQRVLHDVSLAVDDGGFAVVVGPSGCGKSTLLRSIAGLVRPSAGRVVVGGAVLSDGGAFVPVERRGVGWVPQDPSLFPHLTVRQNIDFGARGLRRGAGTGGAGAHPPTAELLELTGLAGLADRYPDQLSGGQAQRSALARALAAAPRLLLLDEPFAALDPALREELRDQLRALLKRLGITGVMVTHDQTEALVVADTIAVLRDGRVEQQGAPAQVYRAPLSPWLADFFGDSVTLPAIADGPRARTLLGELELTDGRHGSTVVMLRPEQLGLVSHGLPARVTRMRYGGHDVLLDLVADDGTPLLVRTLAARTPSVGEHVQVGVHAGERALVYPRTAAS